LSIAIHSLPNGVRVVTEPMPGLASAAVGVWVTAGGRHERAEQNGIAHFLEHMAFKGTARRSARQIAEAIEDVGGYINAYTGREMTAFYARVLAADVPLALDVLADIVLQPAMPDGEIEVERGVILQEIGQALDTPDDIIFDWLQETAYPDQAFGRAILGPAERIGTYRRDDLATFVLEHYAPDQIVVSAAGAIDPEAILRLVEEHFGHLAPRPVPPAEAARFAGGERRVAKRLEQAHVALAFPAPSARDDAAYVAQIYAGAVGGGMSSRLFQELREVRGLCYTVFAQASAYGDTGLVTLYGGTSAASLRPFLEIAADELRRAAADMSEAEVERARAQMRAGLLMSLESPSARAERNARMLTIWGRVPTLDEIAGRIDAVTVAEARGFGERLCLSEPAVTLLGPVRRAPSHGSFKERLAA
jgi:predicted Zn-dependent peptidase